MEQNQLPLASRLADRRSDEGRHLPVPSAAPWFLIPYEKGRRKQAFYNPCEKTSCRKSIPELDGKVFWQKPSHGGWLVMLCHNEKYVCGKKNKSLPSNSKFGDCFLWNPVTLQKICLPSLVHWIKSKNHIVDCTLSSPPSNSPYNSTIYFIFENKFKFDGVPLEHVLVYCSPGDQQWRKTQLCFDFSEFGSLLYVKGKLYALYINEWHLEIEKQHDQTLAIRRFHVQNQTVVSGEEYVSTTHYVQSGDEIIGVWMELSGDTEVTTSITFRKLDLSSMVWAEVKSLGDNVLFIGNNTMASCSAAKMGLKNGCLFYVAGEDKKFYMHNIENNCTKRIFPFSDITSPWFSPEWIMIPIEDFPEVAVAATEEKNPTSNLPETCAFFDVITDSLHPVDYLHFRSICKATQFQMPAACWRFSSAKTKKSEYLSPWLVFLKDNAVYNFVDPTHHNDKYFINCSAMVRGATIRSSKHGWLLMSQGYVIFFYNPFTRETIQLPNLPGGTFDYSFSSLPTSRDCIVFVMSCNWYQPIYTIRRGNNNWTPNYLKDLLSCNQLKICKKIKWKIFSFMEEFRWYYAKYLVSCDGNVFLVHLDDPMGKSVGVYKADLSKGEWVRIESLGKYMLFFSNTSSFSEIAPPNSQMENKIYFPKFHGNGILCYSLGTKTWHATWSECSCDDFSEAFEYLNTCWIQPNWCTSTNQELDWMHLS